LNDKTKNTLLLTGAGVGALLLAGKLARRINRLDLQGKSVIITGGSRGLGLELGRQLADLGARLAICARDTAELERARAELETHGAEVFAMPCDVTQRAQVTEFVEMVTRRFGKVDVLINNAGTIQVGPLAQMTLDDFEYAMNTNFWSAVYTTLAVLPAMRRRGQGSIVNISSIGGKISTPHLLPYSASKHALTGFSEGLRAEVAREGINVTTVLPGPMRTGSHVNAEFKGQHEEEYSWFSFGASTPGLSISATRAARRIISAFRDGRAQVALPVQASVAIKFHAIFPELTHSTLALMNRLLPDPSHDADGTRRRKGRDSTGEETIITKTLGAAAAEHNNER
jgi:short-subunit dehydrogenase